MTDTEFRIIRIISDKEFIIDGGIDEGIEFGQRFKIMDPNSNPIIDLDGNELGKLGSKKAILIADDIREHFTVLKTKYVESRKMGSNMNMKFDMFPAHYQRVEIDPEEMEPLETSDAPIHKGDLAIPIQNTEE